MNITFGNHGTGRMSIETRYVASIAGAVLVASALLGLASASDAGNRPAVGARGAAMTRDASSAVESSAEYEARESAALAALNARLGHPGSAE